MSNKRDLRAFVRFDGSGRIVAGSLILRKNKPKVGKWHEIQAYECCNYIPSSTTTTTTQGGGVTPTAWVGSTSFTLEGACAGGGLTYIFYTSTSTLGIGTTLWENAALTIPLFGGTITQSWIIVNGNVYQLGSQGGNVVINGQGNCSTTTTTTTTVAPTTTTTTTSGPTLRWATASASAACLSSNTLPFTYNNGSFCAASELTLNTTGIGGNGTNFYAFFEGNAYLCIVTSTTTAATSDNCIPTTC
jgi:hypothetical protein